MVFGVKAGTAVEVGVGHFQCRRTTVHLFDEGGVAAGDRPCHGNTAIIGGDNADAFYHLFYRHGFTFF